MWRQTGQGPCEAEALVRAMSERLAHRGPDDHGTWTDAAGEVAFGFRRLAILDLSCAGHQPMVSASGEHVIVFNGEIYNYRELRSELEADGVRFRGHSDTEVLLELIDRVGVERAIPRAWGMFACAVWSISRRTLWLVRDRLGKKPLYMGRAAGAFLFGSELKALRAYPGFDVSVDRSAVASYLRFGYVPEPNAIHPGVRKVGAGSIVAVRDGEVVSEQRYWDPVGLALNAFARRPAQMAPEDALGRLESLLDDAVRRRMIADVPLGAFLSGGIDSSTIVAFMQRSASVPVRTFTIGFSEAGYDEAAAAREVAAHLGTDHTELVLSPAQARDVIPLLPQLYDEPFGDSSEIPTFLVSQLARRHVTVALSGDGGDEAFGGYTRYTWASHIWDRLRHVPAIARPALSRTLQAPGAAGWERVYRLVAGALPARLQQAQPVDKLMKLAAVTSARDANQLYLQLVSQWRDPRLLMPRDAELPSRLVDASRVLEAAGMPFAERMTVLDVLTYLNDDILVKVDRASMGTSLETRAPLLDHRILEWSWTLPWDLKVRHGMGKWILREALRKHVPPALFERPKMGFGVPVGTWLRGPLRDWAEDLLSAQRLRDDGFFEVAPVRTIWEDHLAGRTQDQARLWVLLMFQAWYADLRSARVA
jgi:asparagine synthase (glutamine-hydrolysing)